MKLEIHPDAAKNFNEKAELLLTEFVAPPENQGIKQNTRQSKQSFRPDIHVPATFSDKDFIGEIKISHVDQFGTEISKSLIDGGAQLGLYEEGYRNLVRLSEKIQRLKTLQYTVSTTCIKDLVFEWCELKYRKQTDLPMMEFVIGQCEKLIKEQEVWMPISMLHIQSDISMGKVTFKTVTANMFDDWRAQGTPKS